MAPKPSSAPTAAIKRAVPASVLKQPVDAESLERFRHNMLELLAPGNADKPEEHLKNILTDVLKKSYYDGQHAINTKDRIDLAIFADTSTDSPAEVLLETKRLGSAEMPKGGDVNCKALHELMLYFLRERDGGNTSVKHLVITDTVRWYVFDGRDFEKVFYENKGLRRQFREIESGRASSSKTEAFYGVAKTFVGALQPGELPFVYVDLGGLEPRTKPIPEPRYKPVIISEHL